ncbi:hypothetical protein A2619_01110 [candidate division WWE3 bacterium RIFOXYD1_FULL_39_9]|uniref:Uncharacterized protein n=1 Tax=candidate division WWE3 bacterium RIFOXYD1_FULL_39_9 TaxID=1802649 RepID=A0A1F4X667_UNCKA|nr:MAG: hypothetical protein A2619_01110 [candidate division WWE3 bacterium RIFOXYD1_FULL_39_9]
MKHWVDYRLNEMAEKANLPIFPEKDMDGSIFQPDYEDTRFTIPMEDFDASLSVKLFFKMNQ